MSVRPPDATLTLGGLEQQLRRITEQIETLKRPGVEEAIRGLRADLRDIGRALNHSVSSGVPAPRRCPAPRLKRWRGKFRFWRNASRRAVKPVSMAARSSESKMDWAKWPMPCVILCRLKIWSVTTKLSRRSLRRSI